MNFIPSLINLLTATDNRLLMMRSEYIAEIASVIPFFIAKKEITQNTYRESVIAERAKINNYPGICLTDDYASNELEDDTIAYYRVRGMITADSCWRVSTKQLQADILTADENPAISAHFFHISSGGGEAWYMDQLAQSMRELKKPTFAFIEKVAGSAGYYIASQTEFVSAATPFDVIGCIGTMVSFMDLQPMLEKFGMKFIEEYATQSDLKNKKYNDLRNDKPAQYIEDELNPLRDRFVADVIAMRPGIAALPEDHPLLRGETYYAERSIENGLIDAVENFQTAIQRAHDAGAQWRKQSQQRQKALHALNIKH